MNLLSSGWTWNNKNALKKTVIAKAKGGKTPEPRGAFSCCIAKS
jgi:hypothetical protein